MNRRLTRAPNRSFVRGANRESKDNNLVGSLDWFDKTAGSHDSILTHVYHYMSYYTGLTYFRRSSNTFSPSGIDGQTKAKIIWFFLEIASSKNKHMHAGKGHWTAFDQWDLREWSRDILRPSKIGYRRI